MPFLAIFAAVALDRIGEGWRSRRTRVHAEALLIALALTAIFALIPLYVLGSDDAHLRKYGDSVNARRVIEVPAVDERIRALSSSDDEIFVFGDEAQIYALSQRRPATYYVRAVAAIDLEAAGLDRIMRELETELPRVIADTARVETGAALLGLEPQRVTLDVAPEARERFDAFIRQR